MTKRDVKFLPVTMSDIINSRPRCFLHIPKCGGVSIHASLENMLPPRSMAPQRFDTSVFCDFDDFELLCSDTRSEIAVNKFEVQSLSKYPVVSGHFSLPTLIQITNALSIATVLREPRTRLLSLYLYWRIPEIYERWEPYRADSHAMRPLVEFLSEPRLAPVVDNQLCRMLLHGDSRLPGSHFASHADVDSIANDAIERLDELGFVGVLELGDSLWGGLTQFFGVRLEPFRSNVTGEALRPASASPGEKLVTTKALDLLDARNAADALVYRHALNRAGLGISASQQLCDDTFMHQLRRLESLLGPEDRQSTSSTGACLEPSSWDEGTL